GGQRGGGGCLRAAEVGLDEDPYGMGGARVADHPGGGAGPAFELVAVHAGATADRPLLDGPAGGRLERVDRRLLGDVVPVDVVEVAVPGLRRDRQQPGVGQARVVPGGPGDDRSGGDPDRVGVGGGDCAA